MGFMVDRSVKRKLNVDLGNHRQPMSSQNFLHKKFRRGVGNAVSGHPAIASLKAAPIRAALAYAFGG